MTRGGRKDDSEGPERRCIVSGEVGPKAGLIRFVTGPDGTVLPDLLGKLPGRGFWVTSTREALAKDGIKTLEDFATCADWELAGGWTTENGQRKKDEGILEKFDVSLEEAQNLVMTARVMLGWVDPTELEAAGEEEEGTDEEAEA